MHKRNRRLLALIAGTVFVLCAVVFVIGWLWDLFPPADRSEKRGETEQLSAHRPGPGEPPTRFTGVEFVGRKQGQKQYKLHFDVVEQEEGSDGFISFAGLKDGVIYQEGKPYYGLEARTGRWREKNNDFELRGDIVVTREGKVAFRSQEVYWDGTKEILMAPTPVEVDLDGVHATSDRLTANLKENTLHLQGNVHVADDSRVIRSEKVTYNRQTRELIVFGASQIEFNVETGSEAGDNS